MDELTPAGRAHLRALLRSHDRPPTVWRMVAANRAQYARLLAVVGAGAVVLYAVGEGVRPGSGPIGAGLIGMLLLGAVSRDVGMFIRAAALWPVTRTVIDWGRVEQMLADDEPGRDE